MSKILVTFKDGKTTVIDTTKEDSEPILKRFKDMGHEFKVEYSEPLTMATIHEQMECVKFNMENLAKMSPVISNHPLYKVSKMQIDDLVKSLAEQEGIL